MLKVGLLNDSFPPMIDGVANATFNYASIIKEKYGEPTVIIPKYPNVTDNYPFEVYRYASMPKIGKLPYRIGNPFSPVNIADIRKKNLDIMHVHCPFASAVFARQVNMRPKSKKIPVVFTYHTKFDVDINRYVQVKKFNEIARNFVVNNIVSADEVWVVSQGAGKNLYELGYRGSYKIMPNGTDLKRGDAPKESMDEIRRIYRLSDELVFLFVGRMMWYKNLKIIMDALKIVDEAGINFKAFFVGDGGDRPAAVQYSKNIKIDNKVVFTGAVYEREVIKAFFSLADLLLFPSTYDTSGLVVKEAAACDCAALLVKGSCAAEGVEDGVSGLLAEENAESCAKKIIEAARQKDFLKNLGKSAGDHIYVSWEDSVDAAVKRYGHIIENFKRKNQQKRK